MTQAKRYSYNGESLTLKEWAERTGVTVNTLRGRLARGWSLRETLTTPPLPIGQQRLGHTIRDRSGNCAGCRYARRLWNTGGRSSWLYCAYLEITEHRRPCPADRCTAREEADK